MSSDWFLAYVERSFGSVAEYNRSVEEEMDRHGDDPSDFHSDDFGLDEGGEV